jgi:hypothetical protein
MEDAVLVFAIGGDIVLRTSLKTWAFVQQAVLWIEKTTTRDMIKIIVDGPLRMSRG